MTKSLNDNELGNVVISTQSMKVKVDYSVSRKMATEIFKLANRLSKCLVCECCAKCRNKKLE